MKPTDDRSQISSVYFRQVSAIDSLEMFLNLETNPKRETKQNKTKQKNQDKFSTERGKKNLFILVRSIHLLLAEETKEAEERRKKKFFKQKIKNQVPFFFSPLYFQIKQIPIDQKLSVPAAD